MTDSLKLLVPWDLPLAHSPADAERRQIDAALRYFVAILDTNQTTAATLAEVTDILAAIDIPVTKTSSQPKAVTSLRSEEVKEYDAYFQLEHIETETRGVCLVRSLLESCRVFLQLCQASVELNPEHVEQQRQGFLSHARLLQRVFATEDLV